MAERHAATNAGGFNDATSCERNFTLQTQLPLAHDRRAYQRAVVASLADSGLPLHLCRAQMWNGSGGVGAVGWADTSVPVYASYDA
jgi:hypothetical protein